LILNIEKLKEKIPDMPIDVLRDLLKCVREVIPDDTDNTTHCGFRTTRAEKRMLYSIAADANTSVSAICRTAIHDALQASFGGSSS